MRAPTLLAMAVAALIAWPAAWASAEAQHAVGCTLLSSAQLRSTLGLSQSMILRDYAPRTAGADNIDTECGWGVWTGAPPTSTSAMFAFARSGHAGQVGIETWAPNPGKEQKWIGKDYDEVSGELLSGTLQFPGIISSRGLPAHVLHVPHLGHDGSGFTAAQPGPAKGLTVAVGCWWEDKTYKAICVFDEEASFRPAEEHMLHFAHIAVRKFLG
jgi:hypothetical protein